MCINTRFVSMAPTLALLTPSMKMNVLNSLDISTVSWLVMSILVIVCLFQLILCSCLMNAEVCIGYKERYKTQGSLCHLIDGLILSKLINDAVPDTIDERVLNVPKNKKINNFQMVENNNIVVNSAKAIGCSVVNIGSQDLIEGREHLILGLIWQIIKRGLLSKIDIKLHPELYRLLEENETLEEFLKLPPDQILLRWFNYHLKAAKWERR